MPTIWTEVEVDVDLGDFDTDELIEELERRDQAFSSGSRNIVQQMFDNQRMNKDIEPLLKQLYWNMLGRLS